MQTERGANDDMIQSSSTILPANYATDEQMVGYDQEDVADLKSQEDDIMGEELENLNDLRGDKQTIDKSIQ